MDALTAPVSDLMRQVAAEVVMPRYRNLAAGEVEEKAPDDLVTIADREAELRLNEGLAAILPEAGLIGEEAVAADPALLERLGAGLNWIIDPIDGTGNFAAGRAPFGIMVALVDGGETLAGWLLDPLTGRLCHASAGRGATINGEPVTARGSGQDLLVAGISTLFIAEPRRSETLARAEGRLNMVGIPRCAAEQYPRIVLGVNDVALFERTYAWDHAPGVIFVSEAGGHVARPDGSPYRVGDSRSGLLAASSRRAWDVAAGILFG
jgi:fructose-1,6-bisphosphatase/inositol monophosphatase family enzyme